MRWWRLALVVGCVPVGGCTVLDRIGGLFTGSEGLPTKVQAFPVETRDVTWRGWSAIEQTNGLIRMRHVPAAGARTFSLEISGDDAFLVFPNEQGKVYPADSRDASVHFGGHYACIGPERTWSVNDQPFNPHGGQYRVARRTSELERHELRFTSRPDSWRGATISMERRITLQRGNTHVLVDETIVNRGTEPLECQLWDFTQIDAVDPRKAGRQLRRLSIYLPVPRANGRKQYTVFLDASPATNAQFDESLPADVLAVHYAAQQFKIASHAAEWWIAAVDHDTGWTYVKAFDPQTRAGYVDKDGPVEVYGANHDNPFSGSFVEMELLTGIEKCPRGKGITQREHWYATTCKGPVVALTPAGVACERLSAHRERAYVDVSGRYGVFYLGTARLKAVDHQGEALFASEPILVDPRKEFHLSATVPAKEGGVTVVLEVLDYRGEVVGELDRAGIG